LAITVSTRDLDPKVGCKICVSKSLWFEVLKTSGDIRFGTPILDMQNHLLHKR